MNDYNLTKHSGQVFTPDFIVKNMLNFCGYNTKEILQKHIIDNSCGDGAFLCQIVAVYCNYFLENQKDKQLLKAELETYIHGIELDKIAFENCIFNLNELTKQYEIDEVKWDIKHADALTVRDYDKKMDFVVGNPPYVRVHNLEENFSAVKTFHFANGGMTDLYLVFFELGFRMLKKEGKLCYITPSSWLNSLAATNMRNYLFLHKKLVGLIDLEHFQAFEGITTYTLISLFDNSVSSNSFDYYIYDSVSLKKNFVDKLSYKDVMVDKEFYLSTQSELQHLAKIKYDGYPRLCIVKNGFATLADKVFIGDIPFDEFTIPIIKASTGKWYKGFFPYDKNGKPLSKNEIFENEKIANYLISKKEELLKGGSEDKKTDWYLYGRTQALKDVYANKIAINTILKDISSIKLNKVEAGKGLYSGLYILTKVPFSEIENIVKSNDFINYIKTLKKYKSGGYYTFNSKDLEDFLNYKLLKYGQTDDFIPIKQQRVYQGCLELF
ncbi:MAG: N-6 DNA methylase [Prevotellaceae bacterium]|jgi:adenine-specific DNA-methyltransferase|nr:N-6 DNA methylase [Prevotellaceae bacterium]